MSQKIKIASNVEATALKQLKSKVEDLNLDNDTIIRFLRARDLDVCKAEEMLRKDVRWRSENKISEYLYWKPSTPLFTNDYPMLCTGFDFEGSPVIYAEIGKWKIREKLEMGFRVDCEGYQNFALENVMYHIRNSKSSQMVFICDQAGLSYWKAAHLESAQVLYAAFNLFEQHYPEILKKCVILNASWVFTMIFNIIKPAFTKKTLSKFQVFDSNEQEYKKALLEIMPPEALPPSYKDDLKCFSNESKYPIVFEF